VVACADPVEPDPVEPDPAVGCPALGVVGPGVGWGWTGELVVGLADGVVGPGVGDLVGFGVVLLVGFGVGDFDGVGLGAGVVGLGPGVAAGGAGTALTTRVAAKKRDHHTVEIFTTSPLVGACTILPPPMYMPTWWILVASVRELLKNSRSPGSSAFGETSRDLVAWYCARDTRGRDKPADRYAPHIRPEQSHRLGPSAPHRYGSPSWASANRTACLAFS
jgi:hypothetical protein